MATIGQLLSGGFLGWAVQKLLEGWDYDRIAVGIRRNNPGTAGSTINALVRRAESSLSAGDFLESAPSETRLGITGIPVDPGVKERTGVTPGRITYRVAVDITDSVGNQHWVTTFITSNTPATAEEVRQAAVEDVTSEGFAARIFSRYEIVDQPPATNARIISVVRRN